MTTVPWGATDRVPKGQKTLHFEDGNGRLTVTG